MSYQIRSNSSIRDFIHDRLPETPQRSIVQSEILAGIQFGLMFGIVEVDICVPDQWSENFSHPLMTSKKYFDKMSPMFCTTDVPFQVIGNHMRNPVKGFGLSQNPRRSGRRDESKTNLVN